MNRIIHASGRRWFERTNGNTYHSVTVYVDGENIGRIPFAYGYGSQFEQSAMELLIKAGVYSAEDGPLPWIAARDHEDKYTSEVADVQRKKDL